MPLPSASDLIDRCVPAELTAYVPLGLRTRRLSCCLAFMALVQDDVC